MVVVVTEPTPSGIHDLKRVIDLCDHFRLPAGVVINKCDINADQSQQIKNFCVKKNLFILGELPHDPVFTAAMVRGQTITEYQANGIAAGVRQVWAEIDTIVKKRDSDRAVKFSHFKLICAL